MNILDIDKSNAHIRAQLLNYINDSKNKSHSTRISLLSKKYEKINK